MGGWEACHRTLLQTEVLLRPPSPVDWIGARETNEPKFLCLLPRKTKSAAEAEATNGSHPLQNPGGGGIFNISSARLVTKHRRRWHRKHFCEWKVKSLNFLFDSIFAQVFFCFLALQVVIFVEYFGVSWIGNHHEPDTRPPNSYFVVNSLTSPETLVKRLVSFKRQDWPNSLDSWAWLTLAGRSASTLSATGPSQVFSFVAAWRWQAAPTYERSNRVGPLQK